MAVVQESFPEAVTLQEQAEMNPEQAELKEAIARSYLTAKVKKTV